MKGITQEHLKEHGEKINGNLVLWDGCMGEVVVSSLNLFTTREDIRLRMGDEFAGTIEMIVGNQRLVSDDDPIIDRLAEVLASEFRD